MDRFAVNQSFPAVEHAARGNTCGIDFRERVGLERVGGLRTEQRG